MMKTPLPATLLSFEKLSTGIFAPRAIGATAETSSLSSGPRISLLPSATACRAAAAAPSAVRSEEHTSELQSLMRTSYAVFCLNKKTRNNTSIPLYDHVGTEVYHYSP